MKRIFSLLFFCFAFLFSKAQTTTDLPTGSIAVSGAIKTTGTNPSPGFLAIDNTKSKIFRIADKAIITMPIAFDDDDEITITFGSGIIPAGAEILTIVDSNADGVDVKSLTNNTITIDRDDAIDGDTQIGLQLIVGDYDDISQKRSSNLPFELTNTRLNGETFFASDVVLGAEFTGLQRNDDRSLVEFHFTSILLTGTQFSCNLVRTLNGATTNLTVTKPIGDITITDEEFTVEWTSGLTAIGLTNLKLRISEPYALIAGSGFGATQSKFDSQYIFKNEVELDLKTSIDLMPTEIMGGLDDVNGFNFANAFKSFELTSEFNDLPPDNYVRLNYFTLSRTGNTIYMSFRIYDNNDLLIREISGGGNMTVAVTDWTDISQDYTLDGWRVRWNADFSFITSNTTISGLTKENARFKIPAKNVERRQNLFDENHNTLGNTVNKQRFDFSRFIDNIRLVPNEKEFLTENGSLKEFIIRYVTISPTVYYLAFQLGTHEYTGVTVARNGNTGVFDVEFVYPEFKVIATAPWNDIGDYYYNYDGAPTKSAVLKQQVVLDAYTEAEMNSNSSGLTYNDYYQFASSTERMLPYLYKEVDWSQSSKVPRTNFLCIPDHNDEPQAVNKLLNWVKSDAAIDKAIPTVLMQGDFITTTTTTSIPHFTGKIDTWFNSLPNDTPILGCNGNHDLGLDGIQDFANVPTKNLRRTLIHDRLYDRLPQNYKDATVRGTATDAMYYYTDVPNTNVRVIALDQFEYPVLAGTGGRVLKYNGTAVFSGQTIVAGYNVYYSEDQLNFLVNALESLPNESTAIIMTHIPITSGSDANGELNALGNSNIVLRNILKSFRERTNQTITIDAIDEIPSFNINTEFSLRTNSRILYTYGHIHKFKHFLMEDAGNIHTIQCEAIGNTSPYIGIEGNSVSNYGGDVLSYDEEKDELYVLRYGSRRTIGATRIPIGNDKWGFNFIKRPLKLGNKNQTSTASVVKGFGSSTVGGQGGVVYNVTNTNDSGAGSLREAIEATGPRIVNIQTTGYINLQDDLVIDNDNITINTSIPFKGVCIRNYPLVIKASQVFIENLRIRLGDNGYKNAAGTVVGPNSGDDDTVLIYASNENLSNIVIKNCSISWSIDENISFYAESGYTIRDITIQNTLVAEALYDSHHGDGAHSMASLITGDVDRLTYVNNMFAHNRERHPTANPGTKFEFVNNIVYNFLQGLTMGVGCQVDFINNHFKGGSITPNYSLANEDSSGSGTQIYASGNTTDTGLDEVEQALQYYEVGSAIHNGVTPTTTNEAITYILSNVGAFPRDAIDTRVVNSYISGTGALIDTQEQVGGYVAID